MLRPLLAALLALASVASVHATPAQEHQHAILLVATKDLTDPNFAETVVLVTHESAGAIGVILNRPTDVRVAEVLPTHESLKQRKDVVFRGGPVARGTLVVAFRAPTPPASGKAARVLDDVYVTLDPPLIDGVLGRPDPPTFRVYAGYAGWVPGQLEAEILQGAWLVLEADAESIFTRSPEDLWRTLLFRAMGRQQAAGSLATVRWSPVPPTRAP
jgi:putative transcriptional regulator